VISTVCRFLLLGVVLFATSGAAAQSYGGVHPEASGAKCDGVTDDSVVLSSLLSVLNNAIQGGTITISQGKTCFIGTAAALNVGRGVTLQGEPSVGQSTTNRPLTRPQIILAHGATITVGTGGGGDLRNLVIVSQDVSGALGGPATMEALEAHLARWKSNADVGITLNAAFGVVDNVEVVGFDKCLVASSAPVYVRHFKADCVNDVEVFNGGDVDVFDDLYLGNLWSGNLMFHNDVSSATVSGGAAGGYTSGDVVTMASGTGAAVCTTLPTFKLTVVAGIVSEATAMDRGDCTHVPGDFNTYAAAATTGGSGTGLTLNLLWHQADTRPGIGLSVHDRCDGCMFSHVTAGGSMIGVKLDAGSGGLFQTTLTDVDIEAGAVSDRSSKALYVHGCVAGVMLKGVYAAGNGNSAEFANDVTRPDCAGRLGSVTVIGLRLAMPATWHNNALLVLDPKSGGQISGLTIGGPGFGAGASVVVGPNVGGWTIDGVSVDTSDGTTSPWAFVDPTSFGAVRFSSIMPLEVTPPTVSRCGTDPILIPGANDVRGAIATGSGSPTTCTLAFGLPYPMPPVCTVSTNTASITAGVVRVDTKSITIGLSAALSSGRVYYQCAP
jgi:hypothetical protein